MSRLFCLTQAIVLDLLSSALISVQVSSKKVPRTLTPGSQQQQNPTLATLGSLFQWLTGLVKMSPSFSSKLVEFCCPATASYSI